MLVTVFGRFHSFRTCASVGSHDAQGWWERTLRASIQQPWLSLFRRCFTSHPKALLHRTTSKDVLIPFTSGLCNFKKGWWTEGAAAWWSSCWSCWLLDLGVTLVWFPVVLTTVVGVGGLGPPCWGFFAVGQKMQQELFGCGSSWIHFSDVRQHISFSVTVERVVWRIEGCLTAVKGHLAQRKSKDSPPEHSGLLTEYLQSRSEKSFWKFII